jgi:hypothetical protein
MLDFRSYLQEEDENVATNRRQGITHLQQMKPEEFILWMRKVKSETAGILKDIKAVMKIDGLGARFGKDVSGKPYFEGSRTGPVFDSGAFSAYARDKSNDVEIISRASHYDDMLEIFKTGKFMSALPNDSKVICEIFYNPMAQEGEGGIVFVHIAYDKKKLGSKMTIMPYTIVLSSTGQEHPDKAAILKNLYAASTDEIKIIDPNLKFTTIDISAIATPASLIDDNSLAIMKSRKATDKDAKQNLLNLIQKLKDDLSDYLLKHPGIEGKFKLGPEIEGVVLHLPTSAGTVPFKITTPDFKASLTGIPKKEGATEHELFMGRMQPLHLGHVRIIKSMKNPIVVIVKGKKSSEDKQRNPFDADYQLHLLRKAVPEVPVSVSPDAFLAGIIGYFRKNGKEITAIYCGADRIASYQDALNKSNAKLPDDKKYNIAFKETERFASATSVRKAIKTGDFEAFKKLMPPQLIDEWNAMREVLKDYAMESRQFREEATTTSAIGTAQKDTPLLKKKKKVKTFRDFMNKEKNNGIT